MANYPIKMLKDEDKQPFMPFTNLTAIVDDSGTTLEELMENGKYKIQNNVTTASSGKGVLDAYQGKLLNDKFNNYIPNTQKGVANGVATLGGDGKVPTGQLPSFVDDVIECYTRSGATPLSANWLSLTDGGAALTPETGKIYVVMSAGDYQNKQYRWGGSTYVLCNPSDVNSVNGYTGVVVLKSLKIQKNGTQVGNSFNGTTDTTVNLSIPTKTSDITNNSGFITAADDITGNAATATNATNDRLGRQIDTTYVTLGGNETITGNKTLSGNLNYSGITETPSTNVDYNLWMSSNSTLGAPLYSSGVQYNPSTQTLAATTFSGNLTGTATNATKDSAGNTISTTYLKKAGDTMTGSLQYNDTTGSTFIKIGSGNKDTTLMRVYSSDQTYAEKGIYGFSLKYLGSGSGNDNRLALYSDNQTAASQVQAFSVAQDGTITVGKTIVGTINKAIGDEDGNNIKTTYSTKANTIRDLSVSGRVITYTKDNGTTGTITTQDTVYTLPAATANTLGGIKVGTRLQVTNDGTLSVLDGGTADNVDWSGVLNKPTNVSYWTNDAAYITLGNVMAGASANADGARGVVPKPVAGDQNKYLRGDGQWAQVDYAATAGSATSATSATTAAKATGDKNGNDITTTYYKASNPNGYTSNIGTITGITMNGASKGTSGVVDLGTVVTDKSDKVSKSGDTMTGTLVAPIIQTGTAATNYFQSQKFRGQGDAATYYHALDYGYSGHDRWDFYEYGGIFQFHMHKQAAQGEGDTILGTINSNGWEGNVKGNVTGNLTGLASKATGDKNGLDITNYIKGLSISGKTITYTKGDDTTGTLTTQDTVYTLPVAGTGSTGTLGGIKVGSGLSIDSGTGVLSATGGGTADSVEWSGVLNKPTNVSYWTNDAGYTTNTGTITGVSVNGTSVATSGVANITSMPASILSGAIPTGVTATTQTAGDNSTKLATTAFVQNAISSASGAMIFKGTIGTNGSAGTTLPTANVRVGDTYKIITAGTYAGQTAKVGDLFIATAATPTWAYVPSGDEPSGTVTSVTIKATGPIAIDSSSAITTSGERTISHANSGVTAGTYRSVTVNATGHVTAGTNPTTLSGYGITDAKIASGVITLGSNTITPLTSTGLTNENLNNVTAPGLYYAGGSNSTTNKPSNVDAYGLKVFKTAGGYITQELIEGNTTAGKRWTRQYNGSTWGSWTEMKWTDTDTKNTAGSTDSSSKLFIIGATSQAANPQTYSQDTAYVGTDGHLYSNSKQVVNLSDTQALTNKTYNGYTLAAACAKAVVTTIDTSASLPTSNAVKTFVEGKGYVTTDTKNTAGSTDTSSKIFLIGATSQAANPQTYSDNEVYATSGVLTTKSVQVGGTAATMQYNSTDKCIEFVFA